GHELTADAPRVSAGTPLHGPNLFPTEPGGLREAVLEYMAELTSLGHRLMAGLALSLGLEESYFADRLTGEPLTLFRIFNYPPPADPALWGVGEHTDYGLLTILLQDDAGGLEVKSRSRWVCAPPVEGSFVCNIGAMLDRMTGGLYRSTPHRVRNPAPRDRLSFPFFFDPNFFAPVQPIDLAGRDLPPDDRDERWDKASVHAFEGTYGDYLLANIGKVFPELRVAVPCPRGRRRFDFRLRPDHAQAADVVAGRQPTRCRRAGAMKVRPVTPSRPHSSDRVASSSGLPSS